LKLLLDTHIWLWLVIEPTRIGQATAALLRDKGNELWLSPISTWEALTLHRKGRVDLSEDLAEWVATATAGFKEAVLTHEIAVAAENLSLPKDPEDRMIAATTQVLDLTLITVDEHLLGLRSIQSIANR